MPPKRVTLLVYRSDRELWHGGPLTCRVFDLFASGGPRQLVSREIPSTVELELHLPFDGLQIYGISVSSDKHRPGWHVLTRGSFLRHDSSGEREVDHTIVRTMLVHKEATPSDFDAAFKELAAQGSLFAAAYAPRFGALRKTQARLAFFNLEAKLRETRLGGRSLLSYVRDVKEVAVDRVFLLVAAELRALVERSSEFSSVPGHGVPSEFPHLPAHPRSWKHTRFGFGNVQLSFSEAAFPQPAMAGRPPESWFSVDCDVDLERDLGHVAEFVHNKILNKTTDQTLVYRMLWDQGILPAYTLAPPAGMPAIAGAPPRMRVTLGSAAAAPPAARKRPVRSAAKRAGRKRSGGSR